MDASSFQVRRKRVGENNNGVMANISSGTIWRAPCYLMMKMVNAADLAGTCVFYN